MKRKLLAEFVGTFMLVLVGTGSIVIDQQYNGIFGVTGIAICFGAIVTLMILLLGAISGSHMNPAVSVALSITGHFDKKEIPSYIASQIAGGVSASLLLHLLFPTNINLGNTIPSGSNMESLLLETGLTFFLMLVILVSVKYYGHIKYIPALAIGFTVFLEANFAGPICGASMNPVRTFAPALVSGNLKYMWIYLIGPVVGAASMSFLWRAIYKKSP